MHHLAHSITKPSHCGEHDTTGGESIPMYYSSGELVCDLVHHHKVTVNTSLFKRAPIQVSKHFSDTGSVPVIVWLT